MSIGIEDMPSRIKTLRTARKLSLRQLAIALNVSHMAVNSWEKGTSFPSKDKILLMSNYFGVQPSFIYTGISYTESEREDISNMYLLLNEDSKVVIMSLIQTMLKDQQFERGKVDE